MLLFLGSVNAFSLKWLISYLILLLLPKYFFLFCFKSFIVFRSSVFWNISRFEFDRNLLSFPMSGGVFDYLKWLIFYLLCLYTRAWWVFNSTLKCFLFFSLKISLFKCDQCEIIFYLRFFFLRNFKSLLIHERFKRLSS